MDCHGRMLAHVLLHEADGILSMSWNYPAFLVEDSSESDTDSDDYSPPQGRPLLCGGRRVAGGEPLESRRGKGPPRPSTGPGKRPRPKVPEPPTEPLFLVRLFSAVPFLPPLVGLRECHLLTFS